MNSNGYLGLAFNWRIIRAEEEAARRYGTVPGAVRFISGTWAPHTALERRLAAFHAAGGGDDLQLGLCDDDGHPAAADHGATAVISDELNHNCMINAISWLGLVEKEHRIVIDLADLERHLADAAKELRGRDGGSSMRRCRSTALRKHLVDRHDGSFAENVILVVDDLHGVGALGPNWAWHRGSHETGALRTSRRDARQSLRRLVGSSVFIRYLRETSPFYIYSNPMAPAEPRQQSRLSTSWPGGASPSQAPFRTD